MEELHRVCKNFTRHDKKTRTILLCEMLDAINRGFQQAKTARALPGGKEKKGKET